MCFRSSEQLGPALDDLSPECSKPFASSHRNFCEDPDLFTSSCQGRVCPQNGAPGSLSCPASDSLFICGRKSTLRGEQEGVEEWAPRLWQGLEKKVMCWMRCVSAFCWSAFNKAFKKRSHFPLNETIPTYHNRLEKRGKKESRGGKNDQSSHHLQTIALT